MYMWMEEAEEAEVVESNPKKITSIDLICELYKLFPYCKSNYELLQIIQRIKKNH